MEKLSRLNYEKSGFSSGLIKKTVRKLKNLKKEIIKNNLWQVHKRWGQG